MRGNQKASWNVWVFKDFRGKSVIIGGVKGGRGLGRASPESGRSYTLEVIITGATGMGGAFGDPRAANFLVALNALRFPFLSS